MSYFFLQRHSPKIVFYFFTLLILVLYNLTPRIDGFDTAYYFLAGEHIWAGQIDCLRTPVYPFLLKLFNVWLGEKGGAIGLTILQSIAYLISIGALMHIIAQVIKNRYIQLAVIFLYVISVAPGWCNELMTESLSMSGCIFMVYLLFRYHDSPRYALSISISILLLFLVFLRPTFILFFVVLPCVWIYQITVNKKETIHYISLLLTLCCILVLAGYCKMYESQFGRFGFSISSVCNIYIYDLKRGGMWDIAAVTLPAAKEVCTELDQVYEGNYVPIYQLGKNESLDFRMQGNENGT